jgi:hypothetical protein
MTTTPFDPQMLNSLGLFNTPMANITPFTYRDGETFLEQLKRLREWIDYVNETLQANINLVFSEDQAANASLVKQLNDTLLAFTNQWDQELLQLQNQAPTLAFDPTNGTSTEPINKVIGNVYDNLRYYAYFADQLDTFQYTAAQWDAMQYSARHFDLALAYSPTTTQATDTVPATVTPN